MLRHRSTVLRLLFFVIFALDYSFSLLPVTNKLSIIRKTAALSSMSNSQHFQSTVLLTAAAVEQALAAAEQCATAKGFRVTICIADAGGIPLLVKRLDGAFPASVKVAIGKAETAAQFQKPTGQLEAAVNVAEGNSRAALLSTPYVLMRGGVPIFINDICCGSVGVSGVKPGEDELVANAAVEYITSLVSKL